MIKFLNRLLQATLITSSMTLAGCAIIQHDKDLDRKMVSDDLGPAETLAHKQAVADLGCSNLKTNELSAKNNEGAPLGPVWTNFEIQISGCGKVKTYKIQCELQQMCFIANWNPRL